MKWQRGADKHKFISVTDHRIESINTVTRALVMLETSWSQHGQHRRFLATIYPCICASILCSLMYTTPATIYSCKSLPSHPHCNGGSHKSRIVQSVQPLPRWTLRSTLDMPPACFAWWCDKHHGADFQSSYSHKEYPNICCMSLITLTGLV